VGRHLSVCVDHDTDWTVTAECCMLCSGMTDAEGDWIDEINTAAKRSGNLATHQ